LHLSELTVLTGRNSAGKSNALDAIDVLSRLAGGEDLADALDGRRREAGPVRGGSTGMNLVEHAGSRVGCGDVCILAEREAYRSNSGLDDVRIWSIDAHLRAHGRPRRGGFGRRGCATMAGWRPTLMPSC
jgi:hypothetical protein